MNDIIRKYIMEVLLVPGSVDTIKDDDDLLTMGTLSSMQFVRLINQIEVINEISIPAEDMVFEHFQSISSMCEYIDSRVAG